MLSVLQVGEIRVADDSDFRRLKALSDDSQNWKQEYQKNATSVWTKNNEVCNFKIIKVRTTFEDVSAEVLYDVLHDPEYRKTWDHSMMDGYEICAINPNNDIGYYALRSPPPLRNRDFVTQRSWLDTGAEKWILNHSVNHEACPPRKGFIRGISYLTGYLIRQMGDKVQFTYVAQSDPRGKLPVWVHNPHLKPWIFPEQMTLPRLDMSQIKPLTTAVSSESLDESGVNEDEVAVEEYVND
ncbi:STA10-like protein [Mya arenaria]|uniref:STA10-like protein n=1 Tax=Mya arenaria TaxID=6604 RepID=A0ABY7DM64_MYAAR|nr:STA10-like protein [Mya arenaria]